MGAWWTTVSGCLPVRVEPNLILPPIHVAGRPERAGSRARGWAAGSPAPGSWDISGGREGDHGPNQLSVPEPLGHQLTSDIFWIPGGLDYTLQASVMRWWGAAGGVRVSKGSEATGVRGCDVPPFGFSARGVDP